MGGSAIYLKKGDTMEVCTGQKKEHHTRTLKFTYMNAGYIGYYSTDAADCDATVTMSVFRIKGNEVIITRYDGNVNFGKNQYGIHNLKSAGIWHPDYSQKGYHAEPDTRVYASSRKVTATDDVAVDTPMPSEPTTTTKAAETTATQGSGVAVQKTTGSKASNTTNQATSSTAPSATHTTKPIEEGDAVPSGTNAVGESATDSANVDATTTASNETADNTPTQGESIPGWVWIFPIAGGVILIGSVVVLIITMGKKKAKK